MRRQYPPTGGTLPCFSCYEMERLTVMEYMTLCSIRNLQLQINQPRTPRCPALTLSMSLTNRPRLSSQPSWTDRKPPEQVQRSSYRTLKTKFISREITPFL